MSAGRGRPADGLLSGFPVWGGRGSGGERGTGSGLLGHLTFRRDVMKQGTSVEGWEELDFVD